MIVTFHIEYRTSWGEEVRILGSVPELGKNNPEQAVALTTVDAFIGAMKYPFNCRPKGLSNTVITYIVTVRPSVPNGTPFRDASICRPTLRKACASTTAGRIFRSSNTSTVRHLPKHCWRTANEAQSPKATKKD